MGEGDEAAAPEGSSGQLIGGRYRLVSELGSGGFGKVWKARDERLQIDVAAKVVSVSLAGSAGERAERLARAEREARHAARLRGRTGIVAVYDTVTEEGLPWIVMEFVAGRSLEEEIRARTRVPADRVRAIATAVLAALAEAHTAGIVHRDIKPGNVLLADDGRVLLTDFGIAVHGDDTTLTRDGAMIGSLEYMAPERVDGAGGGPPSDLFSLGVTLYRALEGTSPFYRDAPSAVLRAVLMHDPAPPTNSGNLGRLIPALLRKNPDERPTARKALAMLSGVPPVRPAPPTVVGPAAGTHEVPTVIADTPPRPIGPAPPPWAPAGAGTAPLPVVGPDPYWAAPPAPPARRRAWVLAALIGAAVVVVVVAVATKGTPRRPQAGRSTRPPAAAKPAGNLALHKPVTVSSAAGTAGWAPADVTDGDVTPSTDGTDMGWASHSDSGPSATEWVQADLGSAEPIDEVELFPRNDTTMPGGCFPGDLTFSTSTDGNAWTVVASESGYPAPGTRPQIFRFSTITARYVRVTATDLTADEFGGFYFELKQIEIFDR